MFDNPDFNIGIVLSEHLADTRDRTAGADAGAEAVDFAVAAVFENLERGVVLVRHDVVIVLELLGDKDVRVLRLELEGGLQAFLDARADVARVVDQLDLRAVVADKLAAFLADGVGHDDNRAVALDSADESESDALIAACRLDDNRVFVNQPVLFRLLDHVERGAGLD